MSNNYKRDLTIGIVSLVVSVLLVACSPKQRESNESTTQRRERINAIEQEQASKRDYHIVKLFEHDGCTVYGYNAYGHWEQFFKCESSK